MDRKKQLIREYKENKPAMGVFVFQCLPTGKAYIGYGKDIRGKINGAEFQLNAGMHRNKNLQNDWKAYGKQNFDIGIAETLEYDKDETKIDYSKELKLLAQLCSEKFSVFELLNH